MKKRLHYFMLYKPYGVLSQFSDQEGRATIGDFGPFPKDVYSIGRLDYDSEGLLLLTNDDRMKHRLPDPRFEHERTYLVQVEGVPSPEDLAVLSKGVIIEDVKTKRAVANLLDEPPDIPPRPVAIRRRKNIPTAWIELTLREGRNRQVRRMTAAAGYPTLRLLRIRVAGLSLAGLQPGDSRPLTDQEIAYLQKKIR